VLFSSSEVAFLSDHHTVKLGLHHALPQRERARDTVVLFRDRQRGEGEKTI
jgi:hypothetical protein